LTGRGLVVDLLCEQSTWGRSGYSQ
jgi:hypothetical protein